MGIGVLVWGMTLTTMVILGFAALGVVALFAVLWAAANASDEPESHG